MNIVNLELCKELYVLSGWDMTERHFDPEDDGIVTSGRPRVSRGLNDLPAYSLGYLLRKLPPVIQEDGKFLALAIHAQGDGTFHAAYCEPYDKEFKGSYITNAKEPEDVLAKIAIKLFKEGILTKQ